MSGSNTLTGLTIGSASVGGTTMPAAAKITINSAISINGPVVLTDGAIDVTSTVSTPGSVTLNAVNGDVSFSNGITLTGSGNGLMAKATGNILTASSLTFQTNKGAITFWANSDAGSTGNIEIGSSNTFNSAGSGSTLNNLSGGGAITFAGGADDGAGLPGGYAMGLGSQPATNGTSYFASGVGALSGLAIYSGGGNNGCDMLFIFFNQFILHGKIMLGIDGTFFRF